MATLPVDDQTLKVLRELATTVAQEIKNQHADPWLTIERAAQRADCGERTIRRMISDGRLAANIIGNGDRAIRIHRDDLDTAIRDRRHASSKAWGK